MIVLLILVCAVVGYMAATAAVGMARHYSMNKERTEVGLPTRKLINRRVRA